MGEYDELKEVIANEIKFAIESSKIGISIDLWSDKFRNIHYMGSVAHYIKWNENKTSLVARLLKLQEMDAETPKSADILHERIVAMLHEFDLQDNADKIVFISDRGKNIVNSCDGYSRQSCIDHFVNNIVCEMSKEIETIRVNVIKVNFINDLYNEIHILIKKS